ncbi:MAG: M48 family peptidase [Planctomycetota bacterium]|nr:MAG: M48 family peptidase [Planctomycetota bacterium]REJ93697.1 MAG: M48 family peptidase [Planctomycetota bacterium]
MDSIEPTTDTPDTPPPTVDVADATMSASELEEAKEYGKRGLICDLLGRGIDLVYLGLMVFVFAVPGSWLLLQIEALTASETLRLLTLAAVMVLLNLIVSFPLAFYSGHLLEHRYGLSRQSLAAWLWRYIKVHALGVAFFLTLLPGLYWIIWLSGSWWWIVAAVGYFFVSVIMGRVFPTVIMPLFHKFERLEDEPKNQGLRERMRRLSEGTGLSIEGVYRMVMSDETAKANAMLAGLGRSRRVILGDNLLDQFSAEEIEVIMAHEVGHHVFRHMTKIIGGVFVGSLAAFWLCDAILWKWSAGTGISAASGDLPYHSLPMLMLILTLFGLVMGPVGCAISRHFERQCDRYALQKTGLRDAYRSAFRKLAKLNKDDPAPHRLEVLLFHDHPPIAERIAAADH